MMDLSLLFQLESLKNQLAKKEKDHQNTLEQLTDSSGKEKEFIRQLQQEIDEKDTEMASYPLPRLWMA